MNTNRRNFIKTSAITAGMIGLGSIARATSTTGVKPGKEAFNVSSEEDKHLQVQDGNTTMTIELRMWNYADSSLEYYRELIAMIRKYPGSCDAVWLFIPPGSLKMTYHEKHIDALKPIVAALRAAGIGVSFQADVCVADHSEMYGRTFYRDISPEGRSNGLYCWRDENAIKYLSDVLELYAREIKPDVVWFDDPLGIRLWGQPPRCLCPFCLKMFNEKYGFSLSKEELERQITNDLAVRERFVEFSYEGLSAYAGKLARAVYKGSPSTAMGQQHGDYYGKSYLRILESYKHAGGREVLSRSGAGAYSDRAPLDILNKARQIEWQLSTLPDYVTGRCPEVENYPHVWYSKSAYGTCLESTLHLAQGFNFLSFSALPRRQEEMDFADSLFKELSRHRQYWEILEKDGRTSTRAGAQIYVPENYWNTRREDWYNVSPANVIYPVTGFPLTYTKQDTPVYVLDSRFAESLSKEEVEYLAGNPVITDAKTLEVLSGKGYGTLFRATAKQYTEHDAIGVLFTDHQVNSGLTVPGFEASGFEATGDLKYQIEGALEPLTVYGSRGLLGCSPTSPAWKAASSVADAVVYTSLGGKWAVFGYVPWSYDISFQRRKQFFAVYEYIGGRWPAVIEAPNRIELFPRVRKDGATANITLLNASIEKTEGLSLRVDRPAGDTFVYMDAYRRMVLKAQRENGRTYVELPPMDGWSAGTVFIT